MSYSKDRAWSDRYTALARKTIGAYLLQESSLEVDTKKATDLVTLTVTPKDIALRVRRWGYADRFPFQFCVRYRHHSGTPTEYAKIMQGHADWAFYAHANESDDGFYEWYLINLEEFRRCMADKPRLKYGITTHGKTDFIWFDLTSFPDIRELVIKCMIVNPERRHTFKQLLAK